MLRAALYHTMDKQSTWLVGSHAGGSPILYNGQTILMAGWSHAEGSPILYNGQTVHMAGWSHAEGSPISYNGQTVLMAGWEPC